MHCKPTKYVRLPCQRHQSTNPTLSTDAPLSLVSPLPEDLPWPYGERELDQNPFSNTWLFLEPLLTQSQAARPISPMVQRHYPIAHHNRGWLAVPQSVDLNSFHDSGKRTLQDNPFLQNGMIHLSEGNPTNSNLLAVSDV